MASFEKQYKDMAISMAFNRGRGITFWLIPWMADWMGVTSTGLTGAMLFYAETVGSGLKMPTMALLLWLSCVVVMFNICMVIIVASKKPEGEAT